MDKELKEIIEKYANCNKKNIFLKYKKEILLLKENCVPLKGILEYLFKKDEELKNRYENRINTALAYLSRTIRIWQKNTNKTDLFNKSDNKEKKPIDPIKILNSDNITAIDSEYKDLI